MNKTEIKEKAQDGILADIAAGMLSMIEGGLEGPDERRIFEETRIQAIRVAKFFGVDSYPGIVNEGKPVAWSIDQEPAEEAEA